MDESIAKRNISYTSDHESMLTLLGTHLTYFGFGDWGPKKWGSGGVGLVFAMIVA